MRDNCLLHALARDMTNYIADDKFTTANQTNDSTRTAIFGDVFSVYPNLKNIELHENCEPF